MIRLVGRLDRLVRRTAAWAARHVIDWAEAVRPDAGEVERSAAVDPADGPPAEWIALVQDRAPELLEPGPTMRRDAVEVLPLSPAPADTADATSPPPSAPRDERRAARVARSIRRIAGRWPFRAGPGRPASIGGQNLSDAQPRAATETAPPARAPLPSADEADDYQRSPAEATVTTPRPEPADSARAKAARRPARLRPIPVSDPVREPPRSIEPARPEGGPRPVVKPVSLESERGASPVVKPVSRRPVTELPDKVAAAGDRPPASRPPTDAAPTGDAAPADEPVPPRPPTRWTRLPRRPGHSAKAGERRRDARPTADAGPPRWIEMESAPGPGIESGNAYRRAGERSDERTATPPTPPTVPIPPVEPEVAASQWAPLPEPVASIAVHGSFAARRDAEREDT